MKTKLIDASDLVLIAVIIGLALYIIFTPIPDPPVNDNSFEIELLNKNIGRLQDSIDGYIKEQEIWHRERDSILKIKNKVIYETHIDSINNIRHLDIDENIRIYTRGLSKEGGN